MKNCLNCKHSKRMGAMVGCSIKKDMVLKPEEFKPCCDENISGEELFKRLFRQK